ncbi:tetratricopeptide repeat protein [Vibrio ruber]|uniref:tetratricopeptide repeat protein n=1 Tax=Vibrio ruber TaxID=184755 RepID=UPI00289360C4|nr:tetratricopeptide repeat protein [Vibrio ruber]WNJ97791.1 tetratricopeptide repeat protein [Vibrio ruber]
MKWMAFILSFLSFFSIASSIDNDPFKYISVNGISEKEYLIKDLNDDGKEDFIIQEKNNLKIFLSESDSYTVHDFFVKSNHFGLSSTDEFLPNDPNGFNLWFAEKSGVEADIAFLYIDGEIKSSIGYYKFSKYDISGNRLDKQMYVICNDFSLDKDDIYSVMDNTLFYKDSNFSIDKNDLKYLLKKNPINNKNLIMYDDTANVFYKKGFLHESIYLLNEIVRIYPSRTTTYKNMGDVYWALKETSKAKDVYQTYIKLMKKDGQENEIPEQVLERAAL